MTDRLILASGSEIRARLFKNAAIDITIIPAKIDEESLKSALLAENAKPRDIADALAEQKARKISQKRPESLVIGCDQILEFQGTLISKPKSPEDLQEQLSAMSGSTHKLISAAVIYDNGQPIWRQIGSVTLHMRNLGRTYLESYIERNWESCRHCVGGYKVEEEGARLFNKIDGDYFHVLGIPFLEIVSYLAQKGELEG